ncbi:MAG: hypothetical protein R3F33_06345 [Planctomycetota bacterium]
MKLQIALSLAAGTTFAASASGQGTLFSVDWQGPSVGTPDSTTLTPITSGDLLTAPGGVPSLGPLAPPSIFLSHGPTGLGLFPACVGVPGGLNCPVDVDALSLGLDDPLAPTGVFAGHLIFGVDRFAGGVGPLPPGVTSESPSGDSATDVFTNVNPIPAAPVPPGPSFWNVGRFDGNGMPSATGFTSPGLGLVEPSFPVPMPANPGDNLDALDHVPGNWGGGAIYFSLDDAFLDPATGFPNNASAQAHGFFGGDVLVSFPGGVPVVYAPMPFLGLGLTTGPDDLDALCLWENGDGIFQPSQLPYDWMNGQTDMLLFSVRRGSPIIGSPDSIFGIPIEEGDILTTPLVFGGLSPFPGIFISAESLGLRTLRSGTATGPFGDDLVALDHHIQGWKDCDGDGVDDTLAIALGTAIDGNFNGIPDYCEGLIALCPALPNSTGLVTLINAGVTGGPGTGVNLGASQGPPGQFAYFLVGTAPNPVGTPVGSGLLCLSATGGNLIGRYNVAGTPMISIGQFNAAGILANLVGTATSTGGLGFDLPTQLPLPIGGTITTGSTWFFQLWHRDNPLTSNFSPAIAYGF